MNDVLSNWLRSVRDRKRLTQQKMAERIGKKQKDISDWENGKRAIPTQAIFKIDSEFNLGVADFFKRH